MGGGDLNLKKSWHPLTRKNLEIVWTLEQEQAKEKQKLEQLKKEKQKEKESQELSDLCNPHSRKAPKKRKQKLDWMYSGGIRSTASGVPKPALTDTAESSEHPPAIQASPSDPADYLKVKDMQLKIREDPMLAIKMSKNHGDRK